MKKRNIFIILLMLILMIILFISLSIILNDLAEYKRNNDLLEVLVEKTIKKDESLQDSTIDWSYLQSINKNIVGWIEVEDTNINYPVLQANDTYYLKHSFDKQVNNNGSIFTLNTYPFEDKETIIYGHNMRNGSMFSNLDKYLNESFLFSHSKFKIYTPLQNYEAKIFSVYSIDLKTENNNIKYLEFEDKIQYYKTASAYDIEYRETIQKIVKLSTCSYLNAHTTPTDQRYYIIASLTKI